MESRALKLHIAKGPREGDELEFKAGSRIRIGRVVRGNNVAIKDVGISSKHLSIELDTRSGNWILQDLGSSNGTFINGSSAALCPDTPYTINDGDSIKIGESTSILVKLDTSVVEGSELPQNPTRRRRAAGRRNLEGADTGVFKEKLGLKEALESVEAAGVLKESEEKLGLKEAEESVKAAGVLKESEIDLVSNSIKEVKNTGLEKEKMVQAPGVIPRMTRSRKKKEEDPIGTNNCEEKNNMGKRTRPRSRRKRNEKKDAEKLDPVVEETIAVDKVNDEVSSLEEDTGQPDQMNNEEPISGKGDYDGRQKRNEAAANGHADLRKPELCADGKNVSSLDLAKLTVREWFDYLEVYLPKQIVDETEKSLTAMREKVELIKDYVKEQRKKN